jgi:hypothetical protein
LFQKDIAAEAASTAVQPPAGMHHAALRQ